MTVSFLPLHFNCSNLIRIDLITPVYTAEDIDIVAKLAHKIWNQHYVPIIGQAQVDYMLDKFQNADAFSKQIQDGYRYYLLSHDNQYCGYLALVLNASEKKLMISKIYLDADFRGKGLGLTLMDFAVEEAQKERCETVWLTVNRDNTNSINWYKKYGFEIIDEVKADIGNGYYMDDFMMEKSLV